MLELSREYFETKYHFRKGNWNSTYRQELKNKGYLSDAEIIHHLPNCRIEFSDIIYCETHNRTIWKKEYRQTKRKMVLKHKKRFNRT